MLPLDCSRSDAPVAPCGLDTWTAANAAGCPASDAANTACRNSSRGTPPSLPPRAPSTLPPPLSSHSEALAPAPPPPVDGEAKGADASESAPSREVISHCTSRCKRWSSVRAATRAGEATTVAQEVVEVEMADAVVAEPAFPEAAISAPLTPAPQSSSLRTCCTASCTTVFGTVPTPCGSHAVKRAFARWNRSSKYSPARTAALNSSKLIGWLSVQLTRTRSDRDTSIGQSPQSNRSSRNSSTPVTPLAPRRASSAT
mmetsp:Transcript_16919/g.43455  ORF Transcript_16919/g.43455 Transcript_16919/m.43455 type:complete len:257 (-) Transcript_16919:262-1032(-)